MKKLHPKQLLLLELLKKNITDPLTMKELQEELNLSSTSLVHHHISQLEKKGYLKRNPSNPRDYQVLTDKPEKQITYINLYGNAQCGTKGSILDGEPIDRIPISSQLIRFPTSEAFMVKAKGDSMEPRINEGDIVIAQKIDCPEDGHLVVCINNEEVLIKKFQREGNINLLISLNNKYKPIIANEENFRVEGVVKAVYSCDFE